MERPLNTHIGFGSSAYWIMISDISTMKSAGSNPPQM
jgi:hypothetical protein